MTQGNIRKLEVLCSCAVDTSESYHVSRKHRRVENTVNAGLSLDLDKKTEEPLHEVSTAITKKLDEPQGSSADVEVVHDSPGGKTFDTFESAVDQRNPDKFYKLGHDIALPSGMQSDQSAQKGGKEEQLYKILQSFVRELESMQEYDQARACSMAFGNDHWEIRLGAQDGTHVGKVYKVLFLAIKAL